MQSVDDKTMDQLQANVENTRTKEHQSNCFSLENEIHWYIQSKFTNRTKNTCQWHIQIFI